MAHARWPLLLAAPAIVACNAQSCYQTEQLPVTRAKNGRYYRLLDRGLYKAYYDRERQKLEWIEYDKNGDGNPEQVDHHDGAPRAGWTEIDANSDGKVDRWEYYDAAGVAVKVATSQQGGTPDKWIHLVNSQPTRMEYDTNRDGRVDRVEVFTAGRLASIEADGDGDGRFDRWQDWSTGRLASEDIDTDGDGKPDRRLRYGTSGEVKGLESLKP